MNWLFSGIFLIGLAITFWRSFVHLDRLNVKICFKCALSNYFVCVSCFICMAAVLSGWQVSPYEALLAFVMGVYLLTERRLTMRKRDQWVSSQ